MAEPSGSGPVEQEARQLVEAAARWLAAVPDAGESAERGGERESDAEGPVESARDFAEDVGPQGVGPKGDGPHGDGRAGAPGGGSAGADHLCRGCPWCRAKAAAGPLGADTLDSIAHLLSAAAESLSLFAQSRRDAQPQDKAGPDAQPQDGAPHQGEGGEEHPKVPGEDRHDDQSDDSEGAARWA